MDEAINVNVIEGLDQLATPLAQSVLTIGNFDGVHRAHQQLLAQAGLYAANTGGPVVVMTFEPHPLSIIAPDRAPERLTPYEEKMRLLGEAGADLVVVARSDPALLAVEAEAFVDEIVWGRFHPTQIVEGPSFGFGRARRGTPEMLRERAGRHGCETHILSPVTLEIDAHDTLMVSSTVIRGLLREGKARRAALCLGRAYSLFGSVVRGAQRGRTIGFPTANVEPGDQLVPADGVYSGVAKVGDCARACAISIGRTPTFGDGGRLIEAHLLEFDEDVYDAPIRVEFHRWLRGQEKFESPAALVEQLKRDVSAVRRELGTEGAAGGMKDESH